MKQKLKGLVLAGGHGTRLRPLTHTGPKQLIPIANKPNILYCIDDLRDAGITDIGVILGNNMPQKVQELLGDGSQYGVKITYIVQGEPKGIAHAIGVARDFMGSDPFCVYLGDNVLTGGIKKMVEDFVEHGHEACIACCKVRDPQRFGIAELDANGNIISLEEKPKFPKSDLALVGVYLLRESIFDIISQLKPSWRNELEITEAIDNLRKKTNRVHAHLITGWWKDTGKPEDILEANRLVLDELKPEIKGKIEDGAFVTGKVSIGTGTVIMKGSVIRGPTIIGNNCVIGPNTYIGPYTSIGDDSTIEGGEIEASIVVGEAKIKCGKKIVDSLIGKGSTILQAEGMLPKGYRLTIGENSTVAI
ncbi:MAG: glucose-1-phosphate thymidylyltransferase [Thermoplasmata archaeon]